MEDPRLRVALDRRVEIGGAELRLRDCPGVGGPLVYLPDPIGQHADQEKTCFALLATALPPRYRLLSFEPRGASPYQVHAIDLLSLLDQFGFTTPVLVGEGLGCLPALLVAAWFPTRVAGLVLIEPTCAAPPDDRIEARALRDCPPDWPALLKAVRCPLLELPANAPLVQSIEDFLVSLRVGRPASRQRLHPTSPARPSA